jgi:hypothetical protein
MKSSISISIAPYGSMPIPKPTGQAFYQTPHESIVPKGRPLVYSTLGLLLFILALSVGETTAQVCTTATCTAATCAETDVLAALPSPANTNPTVTVNIPACTATTWTSQLGYTQTAAVTTLNVLGNGTPNAGSSTTGASASCVGTNILDGFSTGSPIFATDRLIKISITYPQTFTIGCMILDPATVSTPLYNPVAIVGTCTGSGCPSVRVHNLNLGHNIQWSETGNSSNATSALLLVNVFGVLDHNTICTSSAYCPNSDGFELFQSQMGAYLGVGIDGDNSWQQADSLGGANNLFAENNLGYNGGFLPMNDAEQFDAINNRGGARVVMRYNTWHQGKNNAGGFGIFQSHGTESGGRNRGGREAEVYNNTILCDGTSTNCSGVDGGLRSGTGLFFNNATTSILGSIGPYVALQTLRVVESVTNPFSPQCGGFSPWDKNGGASVTASSTVTAHGAGTVTDTSQTWTAHQFQPIAGGSGFMFADTTGLVSSSSVAFITDNTSNQLSIGNLASGSVTTGDNYSITGASVLYTGTITSTSVADPNSTFDAMTDSGASFASLLPNGAPYSVCDINGGWCSEITNFTSTLIQVAPCVNPPGGCSPYGFNNGDKYLVARATSCLDQSARGQQTSTILSGNPPTPIAAVTETIDPIYHWGDSISGATPSADIFTGTARLINYRDFYTQASGIQTTSSSPFACDGSTGGTGWGTLARRPASCSGACSANNPGCGYFATDSGSQGTLYTWQSGAWVSAYQPYTYPHPLDSSGIIPPAPAPTMFAFTFNNNFCGTLVATNKKVCCKNGSGSFAQVAGKAWSPMSGTLAANCRVQ